MLLVDVIQRVFSEEDFFELKKGNFMADLEIHRLFRTNTFNTKLCYEELERTGKLKSPLVHDRFRIARDVDYTKYRRDVRNQQSEIKPYLNNRSCIRTKETRSPAVSLLHPTTEFQVFNFERKRHGTSFKRTH